jgi:hypothetical protein
VIKDAIVELKERRGPLLREEIDEHREMGAGRRENLVLHDGSGATRVGLGTGKEVTWVREGPRGCRAGKKITLDVLGRKSRGRSGEGGRSGGRPRGGEEGRMGGGEEGQEGVQPNSAEMWEKLLTGWPIYIGVDVLVICCSNSRNNLEN